MTSLVRRFRRTPDGGLEEVGLVEAPAAPAGEDGFVGERPAAVMQPNGSYTPRFRAYRPAIAPPPISGHYRADPSYAADNDVPASRARAHTNYWPGRTVTPRPPARSPSGVLTPASPVTAPGPPTSPTGLRPGWKPALMRPSGRPGPDWPTPMRKSPGRSPQPETTKVSCLAEPRWSPPKPNSKPPRSSPAKSAEQAPPSTSSGGERRRGSTGPDARPGRQARQPRSPPGAAWIAAKLAPGPGPAEDPSRWL